MQRWCADCMHVWNKLGCTGLVAGRGGLVFTAVCPLPGPGLLPLFNASLAPSREGRERNCRGIWRATHMMVCSDPHIYMHKLRHKSPYAGAWSRCPGAPAGTVVVMDPGGPVAGAHNRQAHASACRALAMSDHLHPGSGTACPPWPVCEYVLAPGPGPGARVGGLRVASPRPGPGPGRLADRRTT